MVLHPAEASAREKIRRAETHFAELHALVTAYRDSRPCRVLIDPPGNKGTPIGDGHRVFLWYETPPPTIGTVAGDVVTNLRAALDHVVWGIADPEVRRGNTKFPIHFSDTDEDRRNFRRSLRGVSKPAFDAIEKMQPYHGPGEPRDRPLAVLAELVNEDKHRNLITARLMVPLKDFFGAFEEANITLKLPSPAPGAFEALLQEPAGRGGIVLVDPQRNVWELQVKVETPAVKVVTNTSPQRELFDTLHEVRIAVIQALDEIVVYLPKYDASVFEIPTITGSWSGAA